MTIIGRKMNTSKNIYKYDCDFYLFECSTIIPADAIANLSMSNNYSNKIQKIIEYQC